jgi:hypothetical protein
MSQSPVGLLLLVATGTFESSGDTGPVSQESSAQEPRIKEQKAPSPIRARSERGIAAASPISLSESLDHPRFLKFLPATSGQVPRAEIGLFPAACDVPSGF